MFGGCATKSTYSNKSDFDLDIEKYLKFKAKKAYSFAMDSDGAWVSAYCYELPTQEVASTSSLKQCNERREEKNIKSPCKLYFEGNTMIQ